MPLESKRGTETAATPNPKSAQHLAWSQPLPAVLLLYKVMNRYEHPRLYFLIIGFLKTGF